ncbi:MAG: YbbR-like domain-containing protein [Prevotella sp.]|nr:YbbR-like domain-containing protein [Prevotella sp.]
MDKRRRILHIIRKSLFKLVNKDFLIFLFFLALSAVFWLLMTLNETYEQEIRIPVSMVNVPDNVVLLSPDTDTVKVTVRDRGLVLLGYVYGDALRPVRLNFKSYVRGTESASVTASELQRLVYQQLSASSKIVGVKSEKLEFFFNYGLCKRVPVRWSGRVIPEHLYFISQVEYWPDSVDVYAAEEKLDSISTVYTEQLNYANFRDTLSITCGLQPMRGVKCVPDKIKMAFYTDVLTEASMSDIPVKGINMPPGKVLRTFPAKVTVRFVTGVSQFKSLRPSDFTVVVDYNDVASHPSDKCTLYLKSVPHGISRAKLDLKQVDYLIEEE